MSPAHRPHAAKRGALSPELKQRLDTATERHQLSHRLMRQAVCDYLEVLRGDGVPRGEAFGRVQAFVVAARAGAHADRDVSDGLHDEITEWCTERWPI